MSRSVTLIFGPPAVGKTTLIHLFLKSSPNFAAASAGSLIQQNIAIQDRDRLRLQSKDHILANQYKLVHNFKKFCMDNPQKNIILDGHCLIDNGEDLIEVPIAIIKNLQPTRIILICDEPQSIFGKRKQDVGNRPLRNIESIEKIGYFLSKSKKVCKYYAEQLNIPFHIISPRIEELSAQLLS